MSAVFKIAPTPDKLDVISSTLTGYWQNDVWDLYNPVFDNMRPKRLGGRKKVDFTPLPAVLRDEAKFFFVKRLKEQSMRLSTAMQYCDRFNRLGDFLNHTYPNATSFIDLPIDKAMTKWRSYLVEHGLFIVRNGSYSTLNQRLLTQMHNFFEKYYDTRDEFEKDVWDSRNIPGAKITNTSANYFLDFTAIPLVYRPLVKKYIKVQLGLCSVMNCAMHIRAIKLFLLHLVSLHPEWTDLRQLSRSDIEDYLAWYKQFAAELGAQQHCRNIIAIRMFINHMQRSEYLEAPLKPANILIWKEDLPKKQKVTEHNIKFIPEGVLCQLEDNLEHLKAEYIPAVILLRASGWRISDIFNLRYDTCLERTAQGWWLCGDIPKTQVLNHRVPITDEVATIMQALVEDVKEKSTPDNNPQKYVFVRLDGKRKGLPPQSNLLRRALLRLAKKYNIVDDQGNMFRFKNHAFRHTKGIELINNGMNIVHVQKWMAHASPEMTLRYAKILDRTMRKSWEEAMKNGAFRLDNTGKPVKVDISSIENEDVIEWEYIRHNLDAVRMPLGYCLKPKKIDCKHQLNPCLSCRNLCTTPDFIPQYELEIREVKILIERGKTQNQTLWVEKNQYLLERYEAILGVLKNGKAHHQAGKKGREYVGEERQNLASS